MNAAELSASIDRITAEVATATGISQTLVATVAGWVALVLVMAAARLNRRVRARRRAKIANLPVRPAVGDLVRLGMGSTAARWESAPNAIRIGSDHGNEAVYEFNPEIDRLGFAGVVFAHRVHARPGRPAAHAGVVFTDAAGKNLFPAGDLNALEKSLLRETYLALFDARDAARRAASVAAGEATVVAATLAAADSRNAPPVVAPPIEAVADCLARLKAAADKAGIDTAVAISDVPAAKQPAAAPSKTTEYAPWVAAAKAAARVENEAG